MKTKMTVQIDKELLQTVRTLVHWEADLTLRTFVEDALKSHLKTFPSSEKWREAVHKLKSGRPLKDF